jgi:hypothetical protein
MVMLQAYVDDSGSSQRDHTFVLGGFVSTVDDWKRFSGAWKKALDAKPTIAYFKANQAILGRGEFKGWTDAEVAAKVRSLVTVVKCHVMVRVHCWMAWEDYKGFKGAFLPEVDDPYFQLFYRLIYAVAGFQVQYHWDTPTDFGFDDQGKLGEDTLRWYAIARQILSPAFKRVLGDTPSFEDDKEVLPLQAADLYAWSVRRRLRNNTPPDWGLEVLADAQSVQSIERRIEVADLKEALTDTMKAAVENYRLDRSSKQTS